MLCFNSTGLICKALSLGIVQFKGKLCLFVSKKFNSDSSDPMGFRSVTGGIKARSCNLRLRPESCIFI